MARAKSHGPDKEETKKKEPKGLQPYSGKVDGHRYVIYASYAREGHDVGRILVMKFLGTFAAKRLALMLIAKDEFVWEEKPLGGHAMIVTERGVKIHAHAEQMKEIMDHEFTDEEAEWRDDMLTGNCNRFLYGRDADTRVDEELPVSSPHNRRVVEAITGDDRDTDGPNEESRDDSSRRKRRVKPVVTPREPRPDTSGLVTANDIAKRLGVEGSAVRGVLRGKAFTKPDHGNWAWEPEIAKKIEKQVSKELKAISDAKKKK